MAYLREQCAAILLGDVGLRDDPTPEVVHATRVGVRRLRSTLRLFDHVVDGVPDAFDEDLGWLAGLLSPIRDADILGRRLADALDELERDVVGPVRDEVHEALRAGRETAMQEWRAVLGRSAIPGHHGHTGALVCVGAGPRERQVRPAKILRKAGRRSGGGWPRRPTRTASTRPARLPSGCATRATSSNRRCRRRARSPTKAKDLQTTLGEHQDLAVAADFVRGLAASGRVENAFTYGVLADRFDREARRSARPCSPDEFRSPVRSDQV